AGTTRPARGRSACRPLPASGARRHCRGATLYPGRRPSCLLISGVRVASGENLGMYPQTERREETDGAEDPAHLLPGVQLLDRPGRDRASDPSSEQAAESNREEREAEIEPFLSGGG